MQQVFRPSFGRGLTIGIGVLCAVATLGTLIASGPATAFDVFPWLALVTLVCWAAFWRPCLVVSDGGVRFVNVLRTIDIPWPAITAIETRWALTLDTAYGRFTAWAAPTNARNMRRQEQRQAAAAERQSVAGLMTMSVRPTGTDPSAEAAALISAKWNELRAAGHLADPRLERRRVPVRWHLDVIAGFVALVGLAAISVVT